MFRQTIETVKIKMAQAIWATCLKQMVRVLSLSRLYTPVPGHRTRWESGDSLPELLLLNQPIFLIYALSRGSGLLSHFLHSLLPC